MFDLHWLVAEGSGKYDRIQFLLDAPLARKVNPAILAALHRTERTYKGKVRPRWLGKQFFRDLGLNDKDPDHIEQGHDILRMVFDSTTQPSAITCGNSVARNWRPIFGSAKEARKARTGGAADPSVVITSSGTCDGGPVVQWLNRLLTSETTTVAMTGHCAPSTVGGQLLSIAHVPLSERLRDTGVIILPDLEQIKISAVKASISRLEGYSAHGDQNDLLSWLVWERDGICNLAADEVFIQHGENRQREALADALFERASSRKLVVQTRMPKDPNTWWNLERDSDSVRMAQDVERTRIEREIQALRDQLLALN